jgi:hypothetical protein
MWKFNHPSFGNVPAIDHGPMSQGNPMHTITIFPPNQPSQLLSGITKGNAPGQFNDDVDRYKALHVLAGYSS